MGQPSGFVEEHSHRFRIVRPGPPEAELSAVEQGSGLEERGLQAPVDLRGEAEVRVGGFEPAEGGLEHPQVVGHGTEGARAVERDLVVGRLEQLEQVGRGVDRAEEGGDLGP